MAFENDSSLQAGGGGMAGLAVPGPAAVGAAAPSLKLAYKGQGGDFFILILKNVFLTLVTLGIYAAWARTGRRRFIWRHMEVGGHPLEYTGTGGEMFVGYLKVAGAYIVLFGIPGILARLSPQIGQVLQIIAFLILIVVLPFVIYWSRRYLLGRTKWRGIRFGLTGEAKDFAKLFIKGFLLTAVTLGIYSPIFNNQIYGFIMRNTRYGNAGFTYDGPDGEAFKIGIKGLILTLLTLGIYSFWYRAELARFHMKHTHFDRATARFDITGGFLFKLTIVNVIVSSLTLGIAFPWLFCYTLREVTARISLDGNIDFAQITQQAASGNAASDGLASALGVELGI